jgi:branched-chain amino acid transport system permease protein
MIVASPFTLHVGVLIFLNAILVLSLLVVARVGQLSVCPAAFAGIGGYASALLTAGGDVSFVVAAAIGVTLAIAVALALGWLILRLRGVYFVLITFIFGQIVNLLILDLEPITGGSVGVADIPAPYLFGLIASSKMAYYYLSLVSLAIVYALVEWIAASSLGQASRAISQNLKLAESCGIPTRLVQTVAFAISCGIAAIGGILMAHYFRFIAPANFDFWLSVSVLVMLVVGGRTSALGACFGAIFMTLLPELLRSTSELQHILYGVVVLIALRFMPGGLASVLRRRASRADRVA